jgi:murein DD-endopeptidase MepM/ murein hydrolase activator NlpD
MRRFGANRKGDRKHAGADLYAPVGTAIYAMDDGEIINGPYAFYLGTQAVEIQHGDFVARYGEIRGVASGFKKGSKVIKGQLIAYFGQSQMQIRPFLLVQCVLASFLNSQL